VSHRRTEMKTYTIDNENNISVFATAEKAAASATTPFDTFANEAELVELTCGWATERFVRIWNSLPEVVALKKLPETEAAKERWAKRIWERIANQGDAAQPEPAVKPPAKPNSERKAKSGAQVAKRGPTKGKANKTAVPAKPAAKAKKTAKAQEASAPREGSKTAQVLAMLQRKNGATITEIMEAMGWLRHTVRGFMAGAMKKAGYTVESFKPKGGERSYRLPD
jgi:hypothetical protein